MPIWKSGGLKQDTNNSTTTALSASATYTGTATDVMPYNQIHIVMKASPNVTPDGDANTAQGSLFVEFSPDGTNWDIQIPIYVRSGIFIPQTYVVVDRYFRVRYLNDGGDSAITNLGLTETADTPRNQTAFRLNSYLLHAGTKDLGRTIDQSVSGSDPVSMTRGIVMGQQASNAGNYLNVLVSDDREMFVTSSESNDSGRALLTRTGISATAYGILIDLSDTTNWPHSNTGRVDLSWLKLAIDPANNSVGAVSLGIITRIDGTDADISYGYHVPFGKSPERILSLNNFSPSQLKLDTALTYLVTDQSETNVAAVNTGVTLASASGSNVAPALGDIVIKYLHTSGSAWDALVSCFYHSHA